MRDKTNVTCTSTGDGGNHATLLQHSEHCLDRLGQRLSAGLHSQLRDQWLLIRARDAREMRDGTGAGLGVEALGVSRLASGECCCAVHLIKVTLRHESAGPFSVGSEWGDKSGDDDGPSIEEELGDLPNAPDVFLAGGIRKAQVPAQPVADIVAV